MATMTISLPDPMKDWVEAQIRQGDYASTSDYMRDLIRRDRERRSHAELSLDDVQRIVAEARAGGTSDKTLADILAEAKSAAKARNMQQGEAE
jgi:antitoxin ParD1/3/4